ncbi:MAG: hypothetical protein HQL35_14705, partial [Alphaproteobacteria bacterium]|nr:hypothetical protein [Alphaproteobacteria bacterium]
LLPGLTLTPPTDFSGAFNLTVVATSTDGGVANATIGVDVSPVADVPVVAVSDVSGLEDSSIALLIAANMPSGTAETIDTIVVSGVPDGAELSAGTDNGDGTWTLTAHDLDGLTLTPPADYSGGFELGVSVTSTDGGVANESLSVHVGAVSDVPVLAVGDVAGAEDGAIALTIAANMPADTTETLAAVTITGVPDGAVLSAGTDNGDGTWDVVPSQLSGLKLTPPEDFSGTIKLGVTAVSSDGGTATSAFNVAVTPVADVPVLQVSSVVITLETPPGVVIDGGHGADVLYGTDGADIIEGGQGADVIYGAGAEGGDTLPDTYQVALDVNAALTDIDGSEALSILIGGIPTGATLSLGADNGDGTWTLSTGDLDNLDSLTMSLPEGMDTDDFALTVTATATEFDTGDTATSTGVIDVTFEGGAGGEAGDVLDGGQGADTIYGGGGADTLYGGQGDDTLYGGGGDDTVEGGQGADVLHGGAGDDTLDGGQGADVLVGGAGDDILTGGQGADEFIFHAGDGEDLILDLEHNDVLRFEGQEFDMNDFILTTNEEADTATITFGGEAGVSVTVSGVDNFEDLQAGDGYTVTQDGDSVVVTFDKDSLD